MTRFTARPGGTTTTTPPHQPDAVTAAFNLRAIADLWPHLVNALVPGTTPPAGEGHAPRGSRTPAPVNLTASQTIADVTGFLCECARRLADETTDWTPPDTGIDTPTTWRPAHHAAAPFDARMFGRGALTAYLAELTRPIYRLNPPTLARALADRAGHFTEHPDPVTATWFLTSTRVHRDAVEQTIWPTGARWVPTKVTCFDHDTDTLGQRVPCGGEYRVLLVPDSDRLGDMVCSVDRSHRITPAEWQRLERRAPADPAAARAFLERIRTTTSVVA